MEFVPPDPIPPEDCLRKEVHRARMLICKRSLQLRMHKKRQLKQDAGCRVTSNNQMGNALSTTSFDVTGQGRVKVLLNATRAVEG